MFASIFAFALVLVAVTNAVAVWRISSHHTRERASLKIGMLSWLRSYNTKLEGIEKRLSDAERAAPTTLAAEVAALSEAVAKLRATHQRFAGRFDQAMGPKPQGNGAPEPDDEIAGYIALQSATTVPGGG